MECFIIVMELCWYVQHVGPTESNEAKVVAILVALLIFVSSLQTKLAVEIGERL